jgi:hypothetical protein
MSGIENRAQWEVRSCAGILESTAEKGNAFSYVQNIWTYGRNKFFEDNNNDEENGDVARVCVVAQHVVVR